MRAALATALTIAVAVAVAAIGCRGTLVASCTKASDCTRTGAKGGMCLTPPMSTDQFCAFSDTTCPAPGLRWDATAGAVASSCVSNSTTIPTVKFTQFSDFPDSSDNLKGIWGASADDFWVVGDSGVIYRRMGGSWFSVLTGQPTYYRLRGRVTSTGSSVYAVGDGVVTHFIDGTAFPLTAGIDNSVTYHGVWTRADGAVYVVGSGGTILHSTDGTTFTPLTSNTQNDLYDVWGTVGLLVTVGQSGTVLFSDNGIDWEPILNTVTQQSLFTVSGGSLGVFAVGAEAEIAKSTVLGIGRWAGTTANQSGGGLNSVFAEETAGVMAVGDSGMILLSRDGTNWAPVTFPGATLDGGTGSSLPNLQDIWAADSEHVFIVGDSGTVLQGSLVAN